MGHGIESQDIVYSTTSTEWHGLAQVVESIGETEIQQINFPILEAKVSFDVDGILVPMQSRKVIAADLRHREDLPENDRIIGLHCPTNSYTPITNREVYEQALEICKGLDMKIVTMGTLEGCKKFFLSIDTGDSELKVKNLASGKNEVILAFVDLITSHDGTLAQETYDSMRRIVCMNSFRWSRQEKGSLGGKVYHTKNAKSAMEFMANRISNILDNRLMFIQTMEELSELTLTKDEALYLALAYFGQSADKVSTRSVNAAESIQNLFRNGQGNVGKSRYDLFNGATEYWTSGDGTGMKTDATEKQYKAAFGSAADHKEQFLNFLDKPDLSFEIESGRKLFNDFQKDS
jgi:hypothetical protein